MKISFVIPCYNSSKTVAAVINSVHKKMLEKPEFEYDIVAVNDESNDDTWETLKLLTLSSSHVKAINLSMNRGKHAALLAAFRYADGDIVVAVDDDMQSPIDELWRLIHPIIEEDYDVSIAKYTKNKKTNIKTLGSSINNFIMRHAFNKPKDLMFTNFIARKRFVCKAMVKYENPFPHLEGLTLLVTKRIAQVPMESLQRKIGKSGYTFKKSFSLLINGLTTFSIKPLRLIGFIGFVLALINVLLLIGLPIVNVFVNLEEFWVILMLSMCMFIVNISIVCMGLVAEYIGRAYISINKFPQYVIREIVETNRDKLDNK